FVSSGALWERQRRMTEPAFGQLRINRAFVHMAGAMADGEARFDAAAARGERLSLEAEMSHLTADMIYRTIFSEPLAPGIAGQVFDAFARFQRAVANVELRRLLFSPAWQEIPQPAPARRAATEIRNLLAEMLRARRSLMASGSCPDDIAADIVAARDPETGEGFTDEEMLDQLGVFFMAGHETTASVLTWAVFMLSQQPGAVARMRREIDAVAGDGPIALAHIKRLAFTRAVFRETLRLYPPVTFLARVAMREGPLGALTLPRGAMVLISPWTIQRHEALWPHADRFDPDRFSPERESEIAPGTYLPFGIGPRVCIGSGFAMMEAGLILASLIRRYDVETMAPGRVRAVARLTTRPARDISVRLRRRGGA
ncbi:MAG: cytochrome P450, partial [Pseudomonadota bacterium]